MTTPDQGGEPPVTPLDAERAKLRAKGWSEEKIEQILFEREVGRTSPQPSPAAPSGPVIQGPPMSGVLGNANAVLGHVRATIPVVTSATANLSNPAASPKSRFKSAAVLAGIGLIVCILGFAIWQEWQQHIVYETEIKRLNAEISKINVELTTAQNQKAQAEAAVAKQVAAGQVAQAEKAKADAAVAPEVAAGQAAEARKKEAEAKYAEELAKGQKAQACTQRMEMLTKTLSVNDLLNGAGMDEYNKDCNPKFAGCTENFNDLIATIKVPIDEIKHFSEHTKEIDEKLTAYKNKCGWHEKDRDAAIEAYRSIGVNLKPPSPEPTETTTAREPEPTPTPTPTPSATGSADNYDPVEAARMFYSALGEGDGDRASSYVVPEKQNGHFDPAGLTKYFGGMAERLRIRDVRRVDDDTVSVTYHYRYSSKDCDATATVTTVNRDGRALITAIKAAC